MMAQRVPTYTLLFTLLGGRIWANVSHKRFGAGGSSFFRRAAPPPTAPAPGAILLLRLMLDEAAEKG